MTVTSTTPPDLSSAPALSQRRIALLRVGYGVMGVGLAVRKWPELANSGSWTLDEGTVQCLLVGMSLLALLGLRYPVRMLPILLFEVTWKLLCLGIVAVPAWLSGELDGETRTQTAAVLWVVIVIVAVPWGYVAREFVATRGDRWVRRQS